MPLGLQPVEVKHVWFSPWEPLQGAPLAARQRIDQHRRHWCGCVHLFNYHTRKNVIKYRSKVDEKAKALNAQRYSHKSLQNGREGSPFIRCIDQNK
jgi:hypothetical protein